MVARDASFISVLSFSSNSLSGIMESWDVLDTIPDGWTVNALTVAAMATTERMVRAIMVDTRRSS